jgi:hypothetical protein
MVEMSVSENACKLNTCIQETLKFKDYFMIQIRKKDFQPAFLVKLILVTVEF